MLVELFALPGAGKTTVASATANSPLVTTRKDLSASWATHSPLQRAVHVARGFASLGALAAATRLAIKARIATAEGMFRLMRLLAKRDWLAAQSGVILLDQGFLQDLWSMLVAANADCADPKLLSPLIRALYEGIDAKIVVIDVDPQTAAARVEGREGGHSRFDGLAAVELRTSLKSASELQRQIIEAARLAGLAVHKINGSAAPEVMTEELRSLLQPKTITEMAAGSKHRPRRISIVGSTGSGKSYLARRLADQLDLPIHELDELRRSQIGSDLSRSSFQKHVADVVEGEHWIIDGHYRDVRHEIWSRADVVIWLNYPLTVIAGRLYRRFRRKQKSTPSADSQSVGQHRGDALPESASWVRRLKRLSRTLAERHEYGRVLRSPHYPDLCIVELRSTAQTEEWLRSL